MQRFSDVCRECFTVRSYDFLNAALEPCRCASDPLVRRHRRMRPRPSVVHSSTATLSTFERRTALGAPSRVAWKRVYRLGMMECHYCERLFSDELPPTIEHVVPLSEGGKGGPTVLACEPCNSARSAVPYDVYVAAVLREHAEAVSQGREYRRPLAHRIDRSLLATP